MVNPFQEEALNLHVPSWEETPEWLPAEAIPVNARQQNLDLSKDIANKSFEKQGIDPTKAQQWINIAQEITKNSSDFLSKNEDSTARDLFQQKYQRPANDSELDFFKRTNDTRIQDSIYGSLAWNAKDLWMDLSKDPFYQWYVARTVQRNTPKELEESWGDKAIGVAKQLAGTVVGTTAIVSDSLGVTDHAYKDYFGEQTTLKWNEWAGTKAWDLMWAQQAWVDVWFAAVSALSGGLAAPAWIGAKTAMWMGLKTAGKTAFNLIEKEWAKAGAELFSKDLFKEGLEIGTKKLEGNIVSDLSWTIGSDLAEKIVKAFRTWDGIMDLIKSWWQAVIDWETKKFTGKEISDALVSSVSKEFAWNISAKWMTKLEKSLGKFTQMADTIHWVWNLTQWGKALLAGSHMVDALWIPGLSLLNLAPTGVKEIGEGLAKQGLKLDTSVMRVGIYGWLPFAGTLPGIGNWVTNNVMMIGNQVAGYMAKQLRTWVVEQERQKFIDSYGIDPTTTDNNSIKSVFEDQLNYRIRHSLPSEILTGTSYNERGMMGQATTSIIDGLANMSGLLLWHMGFNKAMWISEKYFSPISTERMSDGTVKVVSNIDFLKSLDEIHDRYSDWTITGEQKDNLISKLKDDIQNGDTSFVKTVRSAKEMEWVINDTIEYVKQSTKLTSIDSAFVDKLTELKEKDLSNSKTMLEAINTIEDANKKVTNYANDLFSSDHIQRLQDKSSALITYLKKVADSTTLINQITRPVVVNLFTSDMFSPTTAALTHNKMSVASETALSSVISIFDSILEPQKKIATLFEQKGKMYEQFKNNSVYGKQLEAKITDNLTRNWYSESDTKTITSALGKEVQLQLTKIYLGFKDSGDILNLLNPVFGDFGVHLKEWTTGPKSWVSQVAALIQKLQWDKLEWQVKLSALVSSMIDEKFKKLSSDKDGLIQEFQQHARELVEFDRTKSDAIGHLNAERDTLRRQELSQVPTEKIDVASVQEKEAAKKIDGLSEETKQAIDENRLYKVDQPEVTPTVIDNLIENSDAIKHMDPSGVENSVIKIENDTKANQTDIQSSLNKTDNVILNLHIANERATKYLVENFKAEDIPSSKEADDPVRNMVKLGSSFDIFNKSITNYSDLVKAAVDLTDKIVLKDVMNLNAVRNRELQKIFKDRISLLWFDETQSPARSEQSKAAILRMANETMGELVKPLEMDTIRDMARKSGNTESFLKTVHEYLVKKIWFTKEYANTIIDNSFGWAATYLYNQYRNTEKQSFVNIDTNGKVQFSTTDEKPFLDDNGNNTHLYRLGGLAEDVMKNSWAVIVDKFTIDWKEIDPFEAFIKSDKSEEFKGLSSRETFDKKFQQYIDVMDKKWYEYAGAYQEEGKKLLFVPKEYGEKRFVKEITGIDTDLVNKLPLEFRTIIGENFAKRGKLALWNENTPDTQTLRDNRPNRTDDNIRVLYFDDKIPVDGVNKEVVDGETFLLWHLADTLNSTIATDSGNKTWKPVLVGDKGNFIKSESSLLKEDRLSDRFIQDALIKYADKNQEVFDGLTLKDVIETNWFATPEARQSIIHFIEAGQLIDMISPASSYKNIYKWVPDEVLTKAKIDFTRPQVGDIIDFNHKKMGVKAIDYSVTPEYTKNETATLSNQVIRGLFNMSQDLSIDNVKNISEIYSLLNDIKKTNTDDLWILASKIPEDPTGIIGQIAERFGIKYNDFNLQEFASNKNIKNITNMLSNVLNKHALSAVTLQGNSLRMRSIPQYNLVRDGINKALVAKFGDVAKDQWMVLDRDNYAHLAKWELGDSRFLTVRYPVVGPKVINAPHIIFSDEVGKLIWDETFHPQMDDGVGVSHKLVERFEWDFDGDKLYMFTDPKLASVQKNIESFVDDAFNNQSKAFTQQVAKQTREHTATDFLWIFKEAWADAFEGKKNIGKIDKQLTIADIFMRMDLIDPTRKGLWKGKEVTAKEEFVWKMGELLQKSVDNQEISMNDMFGLVKDYFSMPISKLVQSPFRNISAGNIGWDSKNFKTKEDYFNRLGGTRNNIINSGTVGDMITATLKAMSPEDYKMVTIEGKERSYKAIKITNPSIIALLEKTIWNYSLHNVESKLRSVLDFIGKVDYTDNGPIPKSIDNFEQSYKDSKEAFDFFGQDINRNIFKNDNYLFDFINKIGGSIDKFTSQTLEMTKIDLQKKIDTAFTNVKAWFKDYGKFTEPKTDIGTIKELIKDYMKADSLGKKAMMEKFVDLKYKNPLLDLDAFIISHYEYNRIPMNLLSRSAKEELGNKMSFFIDSGNTDYLYKMYPRDEIDALIGTRGTDAFAQNLNHFMNLHNEFHDDFALNPAKYTTIGIKAPDSIKALYEAGITPEELTDTVKRINSMDKEKRVDVYSSLSGVNPEHIADALKNIWDENIYKEIATTLGLRDITRQTAAKQAIDAGKNADKLYDQKLPDC